MSALICVSAVHGAQRDAQDSAAKTAGGKSMQTPAEPAPDPPARSRLDEAQSTHPQTAAPNPAAEPSANALYRVKDGDQVDEKTLMGWKTWRALACERCHGASQEGLVGPPLVVSFKTLTKEQFHDIMMNGRVEKGMPNFDASAMVTKHWEGLYAYLKGRSDGRINPGRLSPLESP